MSGIFGPIYAAAYDQLYADKDYETECDVLERAFAEFAADEVRRILDLGCGTGGHALPLARRGYDVVGVDRSEPMLAVARAKAASLPGRVALHLGDIASPPAGAFDAVLMMFAVLGYAAADGAAHDVLETSRRCLRPGGLLLFDVWHTPAVLRHGLAPRWRMVETDGGRFLRLSSVEGDPTRGGCVVRFHFIRLGGDRVIEERIEEHRMRSFERDELERMLGPAGFELVRLGGFPDDRTPADADTWNVLGVARAI